MILRGLLDLGENIGLLRFSTGARALATSFWRHFGDEQEKASEQFKDALTRVKEIYGFEGGDLEGFYNKLSDDYSACERRAEAVEERIDTVEEIASDLFNEWENEIDDISNAQLKAKSSPQAMR